MQRWQGAALAVVLCSGCLDPLVDDAPGFSRYVLPAGTPVPSAYDDLNINRKIDTNDGVAAPLIALKVGFADGAELKYWDFGASKRAGGAAYGLATCTPGAEPVPLETHPIIIDTIPGDTDYTPFRLVQWACTTAKYQNELITSFDAFSDAIDLGLITDPTSVPAPYYYNCPVVTPTAELAFTTRMQPPGLVYYKGKAARCHSFRGQEGVFTYAPPMMGSTSVAVPTQNVYEVVKPASTVVSRVVFAKGFVDPANPGARNPGYSPNTLVVTVELKNVETPKPGATPEEIEKLCQTQPDMKLPMLMQESDLVIVGMNNALTPANPCIAKVTVTMNRMNRPFLVREEQ